jgi:hypothetical protein
MLADKMGDVQQHQYSMRIKSPRLFHLVHMSGHKLAVISMNHWFLNLRNWLDQACRRKLAECGKLADIGKLAVWHRNALNLLPASLRHLSERAIC